MMRRQRGMISVVRRNSIVGGESDFTSAPMTPREVRRRYSNGLDFDVVFKKGYKNNGMCAKSQPNCPPDETKFRWFRGMCTFEKDVSCVGMGGDALEEGEGIADSV
jgi:hypothetical protein